MNASTGTAQNLRSEGYQGEALASARVPLWRVALPAHAGSSERFAAARLPRGRLDKRPGGAK